MIRIQRPAQVPSPLRVDGVRLRDEHISSHHGGATSFSFDRNVYGHQEVKAALRTAQYDKCAFCESKVTHVSFGDVEHFRPKAAFRGQPAAPLISPGYFWLAYDWTNLLFACEQCNRRHKGNAFPLADEAKRARTPADDVGSEAPLFIDPSTEDPTAHIAFRQEVAYAIGGDPRGEATLQALGLNRPELEERRRERLSTTRVLRKAAKVLRRKRDKASKTALQQIEALLAVRVASHSEFAAMERCAAALAM